MSETQSDEFSGFATEPPERAAQPAPGEFDEFEVAGPELNPSGSFLKGATVGQAIVGGITETAPILGGMAAGAGIGTLGGPFAPVTVPLGAAIGGFAGWMAGKGLRKAGSKITNPLSGLPLTFENVEDLPSDLRPFGVAGEFIGAGATITGATMALANVGARLAPSLAGNLFNRILDTAAARPATFAAVELSSVLSAGTAGGIAEELAPGEVGTRLGAELAAGIFNPPRLAVATGRAAAGKLVQLASGFSKAAAETKAGKIIFDALEESGEDPIALLRLLKEADFPGVSTTSAQKTGSPGLSALEKDMIEQSREFGNEAHKQAKEGMEALGRIIELLKGTGEPMALRLAAEIQADKFRVVIQSRVDRAMDEAVEAARGITKDNPEEASRLSVVARNILDGTIKLFRKEETKAWDLVDKTAVASPAKVLTEHASLRGSMLPREKMPEVIEGTIHDLQRAGELLAKAEAGEVTKGLTGKALKAAEGRIADAEEMFTSGFLIKLRARMLVLARATDDPNEARLYGRLAEATLDDLNDTFKGLGQADEAYDVARTLTREFNDVFTRTFAGAARRTGHTGADRLPPELLLRRALGSGEEAGALKLKELEEATRFLPTRNLGGPEAAENVIIMLDAQQRLLRLAAAKSIDPSTGVASARALRTFMKKNPELMKRFNVIAADLEKAASSAEGLKAITRMNTTASAAVKSRAAFSKLAGVESPADAINGAINRSPTPVQNLSNMARLARNGPEGALDGFKAGVWDYAMNRAGKTGGNYFDNLVNALTAPMRPGLPSVVQVLQKEGALAADEAATLFAVIDRMRTIAKAAATPGTGEPIGGTTDAVTDLLLRLGGATLGTSVQQGISGALGTTTGAGGGIIAATRGSAFARQVFDRIPVGKVREAVGRMLSDPKLAVKMLEKPASQAAQIQQALQLHAYFAAAGLTAIVDEGEAADLRSDDFSPGTGEVAVGDEVPAIGSEQAAELFGQSVRDTGSLFGPDFEPEPDRPAPATDDVVAREKIRSEEGLRLKRYKDPAGGFAVGIGFNLGRSDADELLTAIGADPKKVKAGTQNLTETQAAELFEKSYDIALTDVRQAVPGLDQLSPDRQTALIDLMFNLGETRFRGFKKMIKAVNSGDFTTATQELLKSDYAKQLPARAKRNAALLAPAQLQSE